MKTFLLFCYFLFTAFLSNAQIIAGPMLGPVELRDAGIWIEVAPTVKSVQLVYNRKGQAKKTVVHYRGELGKDFNPLSFQLGGLDVATTYEYSFVIDGKPAQQRGSFTTKDLWQWRKPAPNFSFLTGSCAYFNEPEYDRPGTPYGGDSSIFESMAREKAAFMLWLGDNWYTREADYYSKWGLWYRAHHDRSIPVLQNFLKTMPHLAVWDDHDYGPNDIGKNYVLKEESRKVFQHYWLNKSYGLNGEGIFTQYTHGDVDFFMLDDRWWRSADSMKDSVNGGPNPDKHMFGQQQMDWLKNSLLYSDATFKIVVTGSQVLNPVSRYDKLLRFPAEYNDLMQFLQQYRIDGVVFLNGDRHHSEIIRVARPGTYPLYDITCSPLTSGTHDFAPEEKDNPYRVFALPGKQNYTRFTISGVKGQRKLTTQFLGVKGEPLGQWSVLEGELKTRE
jgi:alkaline phosphatase D